MSEVVAGLLALSSVACGGMVLGRRHRERMLDRAGLDPRRAAAVRRPLAPKVSPRITRWLLVPASGAGWVLGGRLAGFVGALAAAIVVAVTPTVADRRRRTRRNETVEVQLADAVSSIASALRSGLSVTQAVAHAGDEVPTPLGPSLRSIADRSALGVPLDDALDAWLTEFRSDEARLLAGVLRLHRRTGAALPGTLDQLARTLRARRSAAREVRSLTAQARLSAAILSFLPIGFFLFLSVVSRSDIEMAAHTKTGATAIGVGLSLDAAAFLWIRRLLGVEP